MTRIFLASSWVMMALLLISSSSWFAMGSKLKNVSELQSRVSKLKHKANGIAVEGGHSLELCEHLFGLTMLKIWSQSKKLFCEENEDLVRYIDNSLPSRRIPAIGEAKNAVLDLARLPRAQPSKRSEDDEMYFNVKAGTLLANCTIASQSMNTLKSREKRDKAELRLFRSLLSSKETDFAICDVRFRENVLLIERFEYVNLYHSMMDYIGAWMAVEALDLQWNSTSVMFFDNHEENPLDAIWDKVFAQQGGKPLDRLEHYRDQAQFLCFDHLVIAPSGHSIQYNDPPPDGCQGSAILDGFVRHFLDSFGISSKTPAITPQNPAVVTLICRRPYVAHPRNPTGSVVRQWADEPGLIRSFEALCSSSASQPLCRLQVVDLAAMTVEEQLEVMVRTDVLVGVHGAGLSHLVFLPSNARVIEVGDGKNKVFVSLAAMINRSHSLFKANLGMKVSVDANALMDKVKQVIQGLSTH